MLGHTCSNLNDLPAFSANVAGRVLRARQLSNERGRHRALGVKAASGAASHAGLSQQDISPLYTTSRASSAASPSQPQQHGSLHRFPRSAQARQRDVRAHIRAPAIPALESQPYREGSDKTSQLQAVLQKWLETAKPPKWLWRTIAAVVLGGQVATRILKGKIHWRNTYEQLKLVGPKSMGVALLTAGFVGMVFTIQFVREFAKLGLTRSVGGVLGLALSRELTPVVTSIILAGRVGSAFAAELGTMAVSEQTDSLRVLGSDPVDYLITPRTLACMIAGPILNLMCFVMGIGCSMMIAEIVYDVPAVIILNSCVRAITAWDLITSMIKAWVFGAIISIVSCSWGYTTGGGAKGVGDSTTSAVVISLVLIFIADFFLSFLFFQGQGDALKQLK